MFMVISTVFSKFDILKLIFYGLENVLRGNTEVFLPMESKRSGRRISDFPDMYPETWIRLIEKADIYTSKIANSIKNFFRKRVNDIANDLKEKGFIKRKHFKRILNEDRIVSYGVDSSRGRILRYMGYVLVPVSAAYVKICLLKENENSIRVDASRPYIIADIPSPPIDGVDPSVAMLLAELEMFKKELEVLKKLGSGAEKESMILIDGPIIDPPNAKRDEVKRYLEKRRAAISALLKKGINVVGFVKRIQGRTVLNYLQSKFKLRINDIPESIRNDWSFINTILGNIAYRLHYAVLKKKIEEEDVIYVFYTYPPIEEEDINYNSVFKSHGVNIYSIYMLTLDKSRVRRHVARVDIATMETLNEKFVEEKIIRNIALLYMSGLRYPLPIELAHAVCRIPKTSATYLLKEVMTRSIAKTVGEETKEIAPILDIVTSLM